MTQSTLPSSTKEFNKTLDAKITDREPSDYDAPWFGRRFFATLYSTIKAWFQ
jgi:hypothetical protein